MQDIKVSVALPVFNGERYFEYALNSLLNQSYKNLEIIVVDDGSLDEKFISNVLREKGDSRIIHFRQENSGVSVALNKAIDVASGKYFTWLSHDDLFERDKIEKQVLQLESGFDCRKVAYSGYSTINENGKIVGISHLTAILNLCLTSLGPIERGILYGCTFMASLEFMRTVGQFNPELRYVQDYDYWLRMWRLGATFELLDNPLVKVRSHNEQTGKINDTYSENFWLWTEIAECWLNEIKNSSDIATELGNIKEYMQFCKEYSLDGAIQVLDAHRKLLLNQFQISVIIPVRGRVHLIGRAIESIASQSHKNVEILVVSDNDDEKIDKITSAEINSLYYGKIIYIKNSYSRGPSGARNSGLEKIQGDYICFLDSDDFFSVNKLDLQLEYMICNDYLASHTNYLRRNEITNKEIIVDTSHHFGSNQIRYFVEKGCGISTSTFMLRSDLVKNYDIKFDFDKRFGEDIFFFIDVVSKSKTLGHLSLALTTMREHAESAANNRQAQEIHYENIIKLIDGQDPKRKDISEFLKLEGINNVYYENGNYNSDRYRRIRIKLFEILLKIFRKLPKSERLAQVKFLKYLKDMLLG